MQLVICRSGGVHRHRDTVVSSCCFTGNGTGWCENSTKWKSCKRARARGSVAWACLAHALQCLCDGRACCPARAMQLVICRFLRFHRRRDPVVSTRCFTELVRVGVKTNKMEIVQTGTSTWRWCMSMFGARFAVFVRRARVLPSPCPATRNLCVLEVSPAPSPCCFNSLIHWAGTGWCENSTRWKSCNRAWPRGGGI